MKTWYYKLLSFFIKKEEGSFGKPEIHGETQPHTKDLSVEKKNNKRKNINAIDTDINQDENEAGYIAGEMAGADESPGIDIKDQSSGNASGTESCTVKKKRNIQRGILLKKERKKWSIRKKAIVFGFLGLVSATLLGSGIYVYSIWVNPMDQFENAAQQVFATPSQSNIPDLSETSKTIYPSESEEVVVIPSMPPDPYKELLSQADMSILQNYTNIMLIGVDYAPERDTWNGKHAYHSDVMIVLSINKITNEIHLISLPRDTYAKIPGVKGIYKLNASLDCGGGWPTEKGFNKVCEAATWMLGGIPVHYYYAVDMEAVKGLVDAVGGVDFDIDISYKMMGRSYKKGFQHLNGQAVLDYMRVRKDKDIKGNGETGDLNRINRQKKMLVAIFDKMKESGLLLSLPEILKAFDGNLYTNTTLAQTAALAAFSYKISSNKVYMHSMGGTYANMFNWNFCFTNQTKRVQLIKEVFGIDVPKYNQFDYGSASALWHKMLSRVVISRSKTVLAKIKKKLDADAKLPEYIEPTPSPSPPTASSSIIETKSDFSGAKFLSNNSKAVSGIPKGYRQYPKNGTVWKLYLKCQSKCSAGNYTQLMADIPRLCSMVSVKAPSWRVNWESSNEIDVDFR